MAKSEQLVVGSEVVVEEKPKTKRRSQPTIVMVKDLEKEFKISAKQIRRHLRKMKENLKPRNTEHYQWYSSDPNLQKIRKNLKEIVKRKVTLHGR